MSILHTVVYVLIINNQISIYFCSYKYVCEQLQKEQKEHEIFLMKIEEDKAKQGQELGTLYTLGQ